MTRPFSCATCGTKPRARKGDRCCYDCMPGGPIVPPPCERCGSVGDYYASGLCVRCHWFAPQHVDSCLDCYAWGATRTHKWLCRACVGWRASHDITASCVSCGRTLTVDRRGICRLCYTGTRLRRLDKQKSDPVGANRHGTQLFLADMHKKRTRKRPDPAQPVPGWPADRPLPHRQLLAFSLPYDLTLGRGVVGPPRDLVLAAALDRHTVAYAAEAGWEPVLISKVRCGIRLLLGMQDTPGAAIRLTETSVLPGVFIPQRLVIEVLDDIGMVYDDRTPAIRTWFDRHIAGLPPAMVDELNIWFEVMHHGSTITPRRRPRSPTTIMLYLRAVLPALNSWADTSAESLREITRRQILDALPQTDTDRAMMGQGLRSIFQILKARKQIFTNPAARLRTRIEGDPPPNTVDLDTVRDALDSPNPARALVAGLAAYHALRSGQLRNLKLVDLRDRHLHIDQRIVPLAEPVRVRLAAWLDYRQARWPTSTNPHLFIHFRTAGRTEAVGARWIWLTVDLPGGVQTLRADRILHEATASGGDPRRLCDLFGIGIQQALRYTNTIREPHLPDHHVPN